MSGFDPVTIRATIDSGAERIGRVWPLYSDVGANPLSGFEDQRFPDAVSEAERLFGGRGYPQPTWFRVAWESGRIDPDVLESVLDDYDVTESPAALLDRMEASASDRERSTDSETLDRIVAKWLTAFLDQGQAACPVPNREEGLYRAWRSVAPYDAEIPASSTPVATQYHERLDDLPETAPEAVYAVLSDYPTEDWERIFEHHLAALPGWVGFIKQRAQANNNPWQEAYPATLLDYMAIRLILAKHMGEPIDPTGESDSAADQPTDRAGPPLAELWLTAWERSFRQGLVDDVQRDLAAGRDANPETPDAQLAFCIDTRSEILRRHLEGTGPYETFGYGGFFGIPLEYEGLKSKTRTDSCPVMVDPTHHITERPRTEGGEATTYDRWQRLTRTGRRLMKSLKNDVAAAFGFVEASGSLFGAALTSRTLAPSGVRSLRDRLSPSRPESFCEPTIDADADHDHAADLPVGMPTDQRAFYAEAAFDLMGWEEFAPVVVFTGHRSETVNNPYKSSIDCGACAGSPGTPNARTLAAICNDPAVRAELHDRGIDIPDDTVFLAAEHNTTTDGVELFLTEDLSERQRAVVDRLQDDLETAQAGAAAERLETMDVDTADSVDEAEKRTADWAEPRPELGLSGNAGFVIGPRRLTDSVDLDGRSFLHSYDWATDPDGDALENIMTGPLVVCQMINAQYYFSTVDNEVYGSGSKTTHNTVGHVGVVQGNGGDLLMGLPLQSLFADDGRPYHEPLRLSVVVHAPVEQVTEILADNEDLAALFDNGWLSLTVLDPEQENAAFEYQGGLEWEPWSESADDPSEAPITAGC